MNYLDAVIKAEAEWKAHFTPKTLTDALFAVMPPEASDVAKWRAVDDIVRTEQMQAIRQLVRDHVPVKHIPAELVGWVVNG